MEFEANTKRFYLAQFYAQGLDRDTVFGMIRPMVDAQKEPWIFRRNARKHLGETARVPRPIPEQYKYLRDEIGRVWGLLDREGIPDNVRDAERMPDIDPTLDDKPEDEKPKASGKEKKKAEQDFFYREWVRIRKWLADRAKRLGTEPIDSLDSMRPLLEAKRGIEQGIPAKALLFSMVMHWPEDARREAGVEDFDFETASEDLGEDVHKLVGYILKLAKARIPILLIGSAGVGKGRIAREIAIQLDTDFGQISMSGGATRGDFLGRHTIGGLDKAIAAAALFVRGEIESDSLHAILNGEGESFVTSQYESIFTEGGVFNFDEIDAAEPNALMVLNDSLASEDLFNSSTGKAVRKSKEFIPMATANTMGLGANSKYTARDKLDFATLDRFRMGRVIIPLDENLAEHLFFS